ncbi:MAG TPA: hypothetical protein PLU49_05560 [Saprospiraceae bacterium]|nr:bleomycin resistance family protein [Saprospirales bacterium]HRQ29521.1 hypothetical protein [Saprospiraceae bacterium]
MLAKKLTPNLEVSDIRETVLFYEQNLGFQLIMAVAEDQSGIDQSLSEGSVYVYAMMQKDDVELMFQRTDSFKTDVSLAEGLPIGASVSFYMDIEGIADFYHGLKEKNLILTELKTTWYGMREFYLKDNNGYILGFAEKND